MAMRPCPQFRCQRTGRIASHRLDCLTKIMRCLLRSAHHSSFPRLYRHYFFSSFSDKVPTLVMSFTIAATQRVPLTTSCGSAAQPSLSGSNKIESQCTITRNYTSSVPHINHREKMVQAKRKENAWGNLHRRTHVLFLQYIYSCPLRYIVIMVITNLSPYIYLYIYIYR